MSQKRQSFCPRVEALEERALMACNVFVGPGGVLNIIGDGAADTIRLEDDGLATVHVDATGFGSHTFTGIRSIVVDSGAGDDFVFYNLQGDLQAGVTRTFDAALREGDDRFFATLYNPNTGKYSDFQQGSLLLLGVKAHEGNDDLFFDAGGGVDMDHATMKIGFHGNDGDDRIGMSWAGLNDHGGVTFWSYGGEGNDLIRQSMWADPASVAPSPGGLRSIAEGQAGDDVIYNYVDAPWAVSTDSSYIDGGDDKDVGMGNVKIFNCEASEG